MGKKQPYYGKSMSINFPDISHTMGFAAFSCTVGNLWGDPCVFHMLKYTIGWELDGKKHLYYGKSMTITFPDFPHTMGFVALFRNVRNLWGNLWISHMMTLVNIFLYKRVSQGCDDGGRKTILQLTVRFLLMMLKPL